MSRACAFICLFIAGCGTRALELKLAIAADCTIALPVGGSLLYEVTTEQGDLGAAPQVCGACISIDAPISDAASLLALLRARAPSCAAVRGSTLHVRLTTFAGAGCSLANAGPTSGRLCATSQSLPVGDGTSDQTLEAPVDCAQGCVLTGCVSTTCAAQGKNCGTLPDGCGNALDCGSCRPPEKCAGTGIANVCGH